MKSIMFCYNDRYKLVVGKTMKQIIKGFSYNLEVGNFWDSKITKHPKSPKSLIRSLNNCSMVYGWSSKSYYEVDEEFLKEFVNTLNKEELDAINKDDRGLWKEISKEEFNKLKRKGNDYE